MNINEFYKVKRLEKSLYKKIKAKYKTFYESFIKFVILFVLIITFITLFSSIGNLILNLSTSKVAISFGNIFYQIGNIIFENLPVLFCLMIVGVLTNDVKALIAAFIGFLVFIGTQRAFIHYSETENGVKYITDIFFFYHNSALLIVKNNLGIPSLNMSVFSGLIVGILSAFIYKKFENISLPKWCSLLRGFPISCILIMLSLVVLSIIFIFIWIGIGELLRLAFEWMIVSKWDQFTLQSFVYSLLNVLLTPIGFKDNFSDLFVQLNNGSTLTTAEFTELFSKIAKNYGWKFNVFTNKWNNDEIQNIWNILNGSNFANKEWSLISWMNALNISSIPKTNETNLQLYDWFLGSNMLQTITLKTPVNYGVSLGACMGIGTAIILTSKKENRIVTGLIVGLMLVVIFLMGNTIALDLLTLFVSPLLFFTLYVPINALNGVFMSLLNVHIQSGLGSGMVGLILNGILPAAKGTNYQWIFLLIFLWFVTTLAVFYGYIKKYDLPFIGRREEVFPRFTHKYFHEMFNH